MFISSSDVRFRDICLMKYIFDQYFLSRDQIKRWIERHSQLKSGNSVKVVANRRINQLKKSKLIKDYHSFLPEIGDLFFLTSGGLNLLKSINLIPDHNQYSIPISNKIIHDYMASEIRFSLEKVIPHSKWVSDRLMMAGDEDKLPDAYFEFDIKSNNQPLKIAIEVELTQKSKFRYETKFRDYLKTDYSLVLYFTKNRSLRDLIVELSKDTSNLIFATHIDDFLKNGSQASLNSYQKYLTFQEIFNHEK